MIRQLVNGEKRERHFVEENGVIGDAGLPPEKRFTRTNIRKLTSKTELMPSGLLGPVNVVTTPM